MTMIGSDAPLNAVDWRNLIRIGRELLATKSDGTAPTDEHIRRSVSSAYYAMFHALAMSNADALIDTPRDSETEKAWFRIYRGLDHMMARRELQRHRQEFSASA